MIYNSSTMSNKDIEKKLINLIRSERNAKLEK